MAPAALLLLVASAGCTSGASTSGPGEEIAEGKLSNNGLVLDHSNLDLLSTEPLAHRKGGEALLNEPIFGPLLAASGGQDLLAYLAICALEEDESLTVASTGQQFPGNLGLAPEWVGNSCGESCQRWVTSCVLAHANAFGTPVAISPRGSHPGLRWGASLAEEFDRLEAAYYGNVFLPPRERIMSACSGEELLGTSAGESSDGVREEAEHAAFLAGRICGVGACGFTFSGYCQDPVLEEIGDLNTGLAPVCTEFRDSFYGDCSTGSGVTLDPNAERFAEVITVYLSR